MTIRLKQSSSLLHRTRTGEYMTIALEHTEIHSVLRACQLACIRVELTEPDEAVLASRRECLERLGHVMSHAVLNQTDTQTVRFSLSRAELQELSGACNMLLDCDAQELHQYVQAYETEMEKLRKVICKTQAAYTPGDDSI